MTVSVVIPTFNRGAAIRKTLDSVLAQTLAPLEILVVDDGSTDGTADWIAAHYGEKIRLIRQKNGGVARARNRGWRAASGDWIAFLDHDDTWHPQKIERMSGALGNPNVGVAVCRWREVENEIAARQSPSVRAKNAFPWLFGWNNPIVSMSVPLVRRDLLLEIGGFDARCAPADDWDLWLRLAKISDFTFVNEVLVDYHLHAGQQRRDEKRMFRAVRRTLGKHPRELAQKPLLGWWFLWSGAFAVTLPEYNRAKSGDSSAFFAALKKHPLALLSPQWLALLVRETARHLKPRGAGSA